MDQENQTLRWSLIVVGIVVVCFCLGYFVLSPKGTEPVAAATPTPFVMTPSPAPAKLIAEQVESPLKIVDITAEKEAERKRKEAEERKRLEAQQAAQASPEPSDAETPNPEEMPADDTKPVDEETPSPEVKPSEDPSTTKKTDDSTEKPKTDSDKKPTDDEKPKDTENNKKSEVAKVNYRVRVGGIFKGRDDANKLVEELRGRAISSFVTADQRGGKTIYHVQIGAYSDKKSAERAKMMLESNGYDATIH